VEEWDILGFFELAILIKHILVRVSLRMHVEGCESCNPITNAKNNGEKSGLFSSAVIPVSWWPCLSHNSSQQDPQLELPHMKWGLAAM
jgi:hypothetical protein